VPEIVASRKLARDFTGFIEMRCNARYLTISSALIDTLWGSVKRNNMAVAYVCCNFNTHKE